MRDALRRSEIRLAVRGRPLFARVSGSLTKSEPRLSRFGVCETGPCLGPASLMADHRSAPAEPDDATLLALVADADSDPRLRREAQAAFYRRHVRYLYAAVKKRRHLLELAGESAEDLVQETFSKAFDRAQTFKAVEPPDEDRNRRRTRAWLGRIAHTLLVDKLREQPALADSPYLDRLSGDQELAVPQDSPALERLRAALADMSEREQDVLRVTALYHRVGHASQRLPNKVSEELARRWNTTSDNIRAIRSRGLKRLKAMMAEPYQPLEEA